MVTGAGDGIGNGIARRFAREGADVIVADFDADRGAATATEIVASGGSARFVAVDVTDKASVLAMMAAAGPVDILVNNAWRGSGVSRFERKTDEQIDTALRMGPYAAKWAMDAALPHMKAQSWGRVINMASLNGVNAHMGSLDYNLAKEALRALTRTAAREWGRKGIRVNTILPSALTPKSIWYLEDSGTYDLELAKVAMGRFGTPEDIAPTCVFLASDESNFVTGQTIGVEGGAIML